MRQRRRLTRALISAAAGVACLAIATPAWASGGTIDLNEAHEGSTAAKFSQECNDERFDTLPDGYDGWHFVLPEDKDGNGDFVSLSLNFTNGDSSETVTISTAGDAADDDYAFYKAGDRIIHAYLFTPAGWTLDSGTAVITGTADDGDFFNLSHTCAGTPTTTSPSPSTSPSTSTTTPPSEESTSPAATTTTPGGGGGLPVTGAAAGTIAVVGVALIGGGVALMVIRRRRDDVTFTA